MAETLPGFQVDSWLAVLAPARTPATIIRKLNTEFVGVLRAPEVKALLETTGVEAVGSSPERLGELMRGGAEALGADRQAAVAIRATR